MSDFYPKQQDRPGWNKTPPEPSRFNPKQDQRPGYSGEDDCPPGPAAPSSRDRGAGGDQSDISGGRR
jgi:hypothetical protein